MSKEKKERTYSPSKVFKELKTVKWPTFKELMSSSGLVIVFTVLFGLYFSSLSAMALMVSVFETIPTFTASTWNISSNIASI